MATTVTLSAGGASFWVDACKSALATGPFNATALPVTVWLEASGAGAQTITATYTGPEPGTGKAQYLGVTSGAPPESHPCMELLATVDGQITWGPVYAGTEVVLRLVQCCQAAGSTEIVATMPDGGTVTGSASITVTPTQAGSIQVIAQVDTKQAFLSLNVLELAITECPTAVAVGGHQALTISAYNVAAPPVPVFLQQAGTGAVAVADDAGGVPGSVVLGPGVTQNLYERLAAGDYTGWVVGVAAGDVTLSVGVNHHGPFVEHDAKPISVCGVDLDVDADFDGLMTEADEPLEADVGKMGMVRGVNDDDDDNDKKVDWSDDQINGGAADKADMGKLLLKVSPTLPAGATVTLTCSDPTAIRVFNPADTAVLGPAAAEYVVPQADWVAGGVEYLVEAILPGQEVTLTLTATLDETELGTDKVLVSTLAGSVAGLTYIGSVHRPKATNLLDEDGQATNRWLATASVITPDNHARVMLPMRPGAVTPEHPWPVMTRNIAEALAEGRLLLVYPSGGELHVAEALPDDLLNAPDFQAEVLAAQREWDIKTLFDDEGAGERPTPRSVLEDVLTRWGLTPEEAKYFRVVRTAEPGLLYLSVHHPACGDLYPFEALVARLDLAYEQVTEEEEESGRHATVAVNDDDDNDNQTPDYDDLNPQDADVRHLVATLDTGGVDLPDGAKVLLCATVGATLVRAWDADAQLAWGAGGAAELTPLNGFPKTLGVEGLAAGSFELKLVVKLGDDREIEDADVVKGAVCKAQFVRADDSDAGDYVGLAKHAPGLLKLARGHARLGLVPAVIEVADAFGTVRSATIGSQTRAPSAVRKEGGYYVTTFESAPMAAHLNDPALVVTMTNELGITSSAAVPLRPVREGKFALQNWAGNAGDLDLAFMAGEQLKVKTLPAGAGPLFATLNRPFAWFDTVAGRLQRQVRQAGEPVPRAVLNAAPIVVVAAAPDFTGIPADQVQHVPFMVVNLAQGTSIVAVYGGYQDTIAAFQVDLDVDTDRSGAVQDDSDEPGEDASTRERGAIFVANYDDDAGTDHSDAIEFNDEGHPEREDFTIQANDLPDIAPLVARACGTVAGLEFYLRMSADDAKAVHVFAARTEGSGVVQVPGGANWSGWAAHGAAGGAETVAVDVTGLMNGAADHTFGIESLFLAGQEIDAYAFDGLVDVELVAQRAQAGAPPGIDPARVLATDKVRLRVAPYLLLPNTQNATDVWLEDSAEGNLIANAIAGVNVHRIAGEGQWLHDHVQVGMTAMPGASMHLTMRMPYHGQPAWPENELLGAAQGLYRFRDTLLRPDVLPDDKDGGDLGGNLEIIPYSDDWPLGRVIYGSTMSTRLQSFLRAQSGGGPQPVQSPFSADTAWLQVGHIDELMCALPAAGAANSRHRGYKVAMASPELALELLRDRNRVAEEAAVFATGAEAHGTVSNAITTVSRQWLFDGAAHGSIACVSAAALADGETVTIADGNTMRTFEFDINNDGVAAGNVGVVIAPGASANAVRNALRDGINGAGGGLAVTAYDDVTTTLVLINKAIGVAGNVPLGETVAAAGFVCDGMAGGETAADGCDFTAKPYGYVRIFDGPGAGQVARIAAWGRGWLCINLAWDTGSRVVGPDWAATIFRYAIPRPGQEEPLGYAFADRWFAEPEGAAPNASRYVVVENTQMWAGNPGQFPALITVHELLNDADFVALNSAAGVAINQVRSTIASAMGTDHSVTPPDPYLRHDGNWHDDSLTGDTTLHNGQQEVDDDFVALPVLFFGFAGALGANTHAIAYMPDVVNAKPLSPNCIVFGQPFGPRSAGGGADVFEQEVRQRLGAGARAADDWDLYHAKEGGVHCGVAARRQQFANAWWEQQP